MLIKGPITPFVAALALLVLAVRDRDLGWAKGMRPGLGLLIVVLVVMPWLTLML